ncbi:MAG: hypothetical protein ACK5LO_11760 [Leucobacter sp.]
MTSEQSSGRDLSEALARARRACAEAAEQLADAGIAAEALAEYVAPRRQLLWKRPATMEPRGEVWRIGPLLLGVPETAGADPRLYAAGRATRTAERGRPGYQSVSREERKEIAAAALRGGFPLGAPVNFDAVPIPLDDAAYESAGSAAAPAAATSSANSAAGPVGFADGELRVRWRDGAPLTGAPTLAAFLADRVALLIDPPFAD